MTRFLVICSLCLMTPNLAFSQGRDRGDPGARSEKNIDRAETRFQRIQRRQNEIIRDSGITPPHVPAATR
jgi:hypothetical protein